MACAPVLAASALVINDGAVLLVKRKYEPYAGLWALPGGHVEPGETTEDAVKREVHEETGITLLDPRLYALVEYILYRDEEVLYHYAIAVYIATEFEGYLVAGDDAEDVGFFELGEVTRMSSLTLTTAHILRAYIESGGEGFRHVVVALDEKGYGEELRKVMASLSAGEASPS